MLLIVFGFRREIRVALLFLFWEADLCCSSFFGGGGGDPCCSLLLVLRVVSVLLIVFCIERGIRLPHRF